jgi:hypothetical protein
MKQLIALLASTLMVGTASAALPVFVANCPGDINVDAGRTGVVYVNGTKAVVKKINENYFEAKAGTTTISISANKGKAPDVSYTRKGGGNGMCAISGFEAPKAAAPAKPSSSQRAGQGKFDASGKIPCAQNKGQPMGQCPYKVSRGSNGSATVVVTRPDGRTRAIFFENGKAVSADMSQADGNMSFRSSKQADLFIIQTGNERYEIPEAVVFGG